MRDYKKEIEEVHKNIEVLGNPKTQTDRVICKCKIDGYEWDTCPKNLLRGHGCHKCSGKKRYTTESFKEDLSKINTTIEVIGEVKKVNGKVKCLCKKCGHVYETKGTHLLDGRGCRKCADKETGKRTSKSREQVEKELNEIAPNEFLILSDFTRLDRKVEVKCLKCKKVFLKTINQLLKSPKCSWCEDGTNIKNTEIHAYEIKVMTNGEFEVISEYQNNLKLVTYKHAVCSETFQRRPSDFKKSGGRCPFCKPKSYGEIKVAKILESKNLIFEQQKSFDDLMLIRHLKFDFYIPSFNLCIEYDGKQHFEPVERFGGLEGFELTQKRDAIKNEFCKEKNIHLLRIPYTVRNIEKMVESTLEKVKQNFETL